MDINKVLSKLFGNKSTRDMKLIQPLVEKVKEVYPAIAELADGRGACGDGCQQKQK